MTLRSPFERKPTAPVGTGSTDAAPVDARGQLRGLRASAPAPASEMTTSDVLIGNEACLPIAFCWELMNTEMAAMKPTLIAMANSVATNRDGWSLSSLTASRHIRPPPARGRTAPARPSDAAGRRRSARRAA